MLQGAYKEVGCRTTMFGIYSAIPFTFLSMVGMIMEDASPVKGSRMQAIGFVVSAVGFLGKDALLCFVIIPTAALKVWKVTRPGWFSSSSSAEVSTL